ncbi:unnamed protein product [Adineta steineri]|uniref:Uncharacterized protein n=1 Tax=Adineta steineri TaxID=433720 RepID=A0A814VIR1_9BILA|nr:unnamed protein product [Adineta steineri]CAF3721499.1 unnamed protein product [Adineta steineri]
MIFVLIELGSLLNSNECNEILTNIQKEQFENMSDKCDISKRNNSRLIVIDDRLARTLWGHLKFGHKVTKLIQNSKPLGFNIEEEEEVYFIYLNYFREAQQNELKEYHNSDISTNTVTVEELYECLLSIRYCYPRSVQSIVI